MVQEFMRRYLRWHRHKPDSNAYMHYNLLCSFTRRFLRHDNMYVNYHSRKFCTKQTCLHHRLDFRPVQSHQCYLLRAFSKRCEFLPMVGSFRRYNRKRSRNYLYHCKLQWFFGKQQRLRLLSDMRSCSELLRNEPSSLCEPLHCANRHRLY